VGSRGSALALIQTNFVVDALRRIYPALRLEVQTTRTLGDRVADLPLDRFGRTGVFVRDLADLLRQGAIDVAVHSLKDVPPDVDDDLVLAAFPAREDPRDVIVSRDGRPFSGLPPGARVGTSSTRRRAQLRAIRPELDYRDELRGNVDTRLRKLRDGEYDAIVLAAAGLIRLGRAAEITDILPIDVCLPDAGQGTLAVQVRRADQEVVDVVGKIDDPIVRATALAERALIRAFGGGCSVPVAAFASPRSDDDSTDDANSADSLRLDRSAAGIEASGMASRAVSSPNSLDLRALVAAPDGSRIVRARVIGSVNAPEALGHEAWQLLVVAGALDLLTEGSRV
jgi:hydroxymethylbilane synthase